MSNHSSASCMRNAMLVKGENALADDSDYHQKFFKTGMMESVVTVCRQFILFYMVMELLLLSILSLSFFRKTTFEYNSIFNFYKIHSKGHCIYICLAPALQPGSLCGNCTR